VQSKRKQEEKIRKEIKEKEREREKKEKNLLFHLSCKAEREVQG
jgi:FtsZ-interacting cell division protein ZipA